VLTRRCEVSKSEKEIVYGQKVRECKRLARYTNRRSDEKWSDCVVQLLRFSYIEARWFKGGE
jgi:hypothetical protein